MSKTTRATPAALARDAENKRRRVALAKRPVSDERCKVPGCDAYTLINEEEDETDCCYKHSLQSSDSDNALPNDGIIDWTAIEVAAQGARSVGLTWVEKDIVIALVLAEGASLQEALTRAGAHRPCAPNGGRRMAAVQNILEAFESTSNRRGC